MKDNLRVSSFAFEELKKKNRKLKISNNELELELIKCLIEVIFTLIL